MTARHYPLHQVFDSSGNPLSGGTIQGYIATTTTPKLLFTNRDDATAGTNGSYSVSLPADGSCILWFDDATRTKLVISDSTASVIPNGTIDYISGEFDVLGGLLSLSTLTATTINTTTEVVTGGPLTMASGLVEQAKSANIASATTTDLSTATGNFVTITGTTTITSLGTLPAGTEMTLTFSEVLILTYNATSLIIPGATNITTFAGQTMKVLSLGGGNWQVVGAGGYLIPDNNNLNRTATIASATTTDLSAVAASSITISGTTTITALGTIPAGIIKRVLFSGALILTYNASSLLLPGATNIKTATDDEATFLSLGSGNWQCLEYSPASGVNTLIGGAGSSIRDSADSTKLIALTTSGITTGTTRTWTIPDTNIGCFVVQRVSNQTGAVATGTTQTPRDDTIPQITEGTEFLTQAIIPKNASNILRIEANFNFSSAAASHTTLALHQDSTANALAAQGMWMPATTEYEQINLVYFMTAGTTSSTTFRVRLGNDNANTCTINGLASGRQYGGVSVCNLIITEYSS